MGGDLSSLLPLLSLTPIDSISIEAELPPPDPPSEEDEDPHPMGRRKRIRRLLEEEEEEEEDCPPPPSPMQQSLQCPHSILGAFSTGLSGFGVLCGFLSSF